MKNRSESGQSLLEVVVGIAIATIVLAALLSAITFSLANAQFARNKALATKYAQESIEWLRDKRAGNWYSLSSKGPPSGPTYCVNTYPANLGALNAGVCAGTINDDFDIFRRTIKLTGNNVDRVEVESVVSWDQGSRSSEVKLNTTLTLWQ